MADKESHNLANRRYAAKNKEKLKEHNLTYRTKHPEKCLWRAAKQRAKDKELPFDIIEEDILIPEKCPILGIEFERGLGRTGGINTSPSLDRIEPDKGYVKGNVQVISFKANMMKSNASPEELKCFADWVNRTYD